MGNYEVLQQWAHAHNHHHHRQLHQIREKRNGQEQYSILDDMMINKGRLEEMFLKSSEKGDIPNMLKILAELRAQHELWNRTSYNLEQTRLHELETERLKHSEPDQVNEEYQEKLKVFNDAELEVIEKLGQKLESQHRTFVVIPEKPDKFANIKNVDIIIQDEEDKPLSLRKTAKTKQIQSEDEPEPKTGDTWHLIQVRRWTGLMAGLLSQWIIHSIL